MFIPANGRFATPSRRSRSREAAIAFHPVASVQGSGRPFRTVRAGASGATSCFAVRTLYRVVSASSRQPVRRYRHIRRRSIELLAVADEVESAIILACGLNGSGPAVRVDAAIYLRFDPNISQ